MFKRFLAVLFLQQTISLFSQVIPEAQRFKAQHLDGIIYLEWIMRAGGVCNGINITRSDDSIDFVSIGSISGICGSLSSPVPYQFQDQNPLTDKKVYYRLGLGTAGYSEVISLFVPDISVGEYQLYPNPSVQETILRFYNPRREKFSLRVFDSKGLEILNQSDNSDQFIIQTDNFDQGLYYFILHKEGSETDMMKGNFFVLKS